MKIIRILRAVVSVLMTMYSAFVFFALSFSSIPLKDIAIGMLVIGLSGFLLNIRTSARWTPAFVSAIAVGIMFTEAETVLKLYPIGVVLVFLWVFGSSLLRKDPIVFHFATLMDKSVKTHPGRAELEIYCKHVTEVWTGWFILNLLIDFWFLFYGSLEKWAIFNGPVCWGVQATIFISEFIVRYFVNSRIDAKYNMPHQGFFEIFRKMFSNSKKRNGEKAV